MNGGAWVQRDWTGGARGGAGLETRIRVDEPVVLSDGAAVGAFAADDEVRLGVAVHVESGVEGRAAGEVGGAVDDPGMREVPGEGRGGETGACIRIDEPVVLSDGAGAGAFAADDEVRLGV